MATAIGRDEGEKREGSRSPASERERSDALPARQELRGSEGENSKTAHAADWLPAIGRIVELRFAEAKQRILADVAKLVSKRLESAAPGPSDEASRPERFLFRKAGSHWDVVFDGGPVLHVEDSLGARYLDYLLHHTNDPISAHKLETEIRGEKAKARRPDSIQKKFDAEAARSYLRQLDQLRAERERATEDADEGQVRSLDAEIETIEAALAKEEVAGDAGERARDNVRKAIDAVVRRLSKGDRWEKEFGKHLSKFVSKGYQLSYVHPHGAVWE